MENLWKNFSGNRKSKGFLGIAIQVTQSSKPLQKFLLCLLTSPVSETLAIFFKLSNSSRNKRTARISSFLKPHYFAQFSQSHLLLLISQLLSGIPAFLFLYFFRHLYWAPAQNLYLPSVFFNSSASFMNIQLFHSMFNLLQGAVYFYGIPFNFWNRIVAFGIRFFLQGRLRCCHTIRVSQRCSS